MAKAKLQLNFWALSPGPKLYFPLHKLIECSNKKLSAPSSSRDLRHYQKLMCATWLTRVGSNAFFMVHSEGQSCGEVRRRLGARLTDAIELKFMTKPLTKFPPRRHCQLVNQPFASLIELPQSTRSHAKLLPSLWQL